MSCRCICPRGRPGGLGPCRRGTHVLSLRAGSVMAKSKNHTAHNQTYKAHRHSIKKPKKSKYSSRKGVSRGMQTDDG